MQHDYTSTHHSDTLMSFVIGVAAGAAVALIFAPASGRDTRAYLAKKGRHAAEKGREWAEQSGQAFDEARETITRRVGDAVEEGKRGYRDAVHRGKAAFGRAEGEMADMARANE